MISNARKSFHGRLDFDGRCRWHLPRLDGNLQHLGAYGEFTDWSLLTHLNRISVSTALRVCVGKKKSSQSSRCRRSSPCKKARRRRTKSFSTNNTIHYFHRDLKSSEWSAGTEAVYRFLASRTRCELALTSNSTPRTGFFIRRSSPPESMAGGHPARKPTGGLHQRRWRGAAPQLSLQSVSAPSPVCVSTITIVMAAALSPQAGVGHQAQVVSHFQAALWALVQSAVGRTIVCAAWSRHEARHGRTFLASGAGGLKSQLGDTFEAGAVAEPLSWL